MSEVRIAINHAIDKLINRFGTQSDVLEELRAALAALDKQEAKQAKPVAVETEAAIPAVVEVSPPATDTEAEPPPEARKSTGRKK